jgi:hypothetical protein
MRMSCCSARSQTSRLPAPGWPVIPDIKVKDTDDFLHPGSVQAGDKNVYSHGSPDLDGLCRGINGHAETQPLVVPLTPAAAAAQALV